MVFFFTGPVIKDFGEKETGDSPLQARLSDAFLVRIVLLISRRTRQNKHFCPRVDISFCRGQFEKCSQVESELLFEVASSMLLAS